MTTFKFIPLCLKPQLRLLLVTVVFVLLAGCTGGDEEARTKDITPLPKLAASSTGISVSGISSGAYMAGQFQFAHADKVAGAAIIAGGPYGCAQSAFSTFTIGLGRQIANLSKAVSGCMLNLYAVWGVPNARSLARQARSLAGDNKIGAIEDVVTDKVYLFSGKSDRTVVPAIVQAAARFYIELGLPAENLKRVTQYDAGHAFVTEDEGSSCQLSAKPFVVDCDYDQAGDLLQHIYGKLNPPASETTGKFIVIDQRPFSEGLGTHSLSEEGVVYVPEACAQSPGCRVHVTFHGCDQNRDQVELAFVEGSGFAHWADTNRLIVLFPQIAAGSGNRQACWDWWGYTGNNFLTRDGAQIQAVNRMLEHLAAAP